MATAETTTVEAARIALEDAKSRLAAAASEAERLERIAQQERQERLRADATAFVEDFDQADDLQRELINDRRKTFYRSVVEADSFTVIRDNYLSWHRSVIELYYAYRGLGQALGTLGRTTWKGNAIPQMSDRLIPKDFTAALDEAMTHATSAVSADIEDEYHARLQSIIDGPGGK